MLSSLGRRLYFPKGILSQSAEAKEKAHRFNATIGIATEGEGPMFLPSIQREFTSMDPSDVYPYAPAAGRPKLRQLWREKLLAENPSLQDKVFGEPIVTSAITHGLSLAGDLFVEPGDVLLLPDKLWGKLPTRLRGALWRPRRNLPHSLQEAASTRRALPRPLRAPRKAGTR